MRLTRFVYNLILCIIFSYIILVWLRLQDFVLAGPGFLLVGIYDDCTYGLGQLLGSACIPAETAWFYFLWFCLAVLVAACFACFGRDLFNLFFSNDTTSHNHSYPRIFLNIIKPNQENFLNRFSGSKTNNSNDCVLAVVSSVRVQNGYDTIIQGVAAGDTYRPNSGEDFDGFIHRDGTVTKFHGFLGSIYQTTEAHGEFGDVVTQAADNWFAQHPDC